MFSSDFALIPAAVADDGRAAKAMAE